MKYEVIEMKALLCDWCECQLGNLNGWPYIEDGDNNYCPDCALKLGKIDAMEWIKLEHCDYFFEKRGDKAIYKDGVITIFTKIKSRPGRYRKTEVRLFDENGERVHSG